MTLQADLEQAVARVTQDSHTLHAIVHGDERTTVSTEGGEVSSPAKVIHDIEQRIGQQLVELSITLTQLHDAVSAAQQHEDNAAAHANTAAIAANSVNLPNDLTGHADQLLAVNHAEDGYTLTRSSATVYGFCKLGAKLLVLVGGNQYVSPKLFVGWWIAPAGLHFSVDARGHLLVQV